MNEAGLKSLFSGIYESILDAQKETEERFAKNVFNTYFEKDGSPKTIELDLLGKKSNVPIFSLLPHNNLKIAEVTFDMQVHIDQEEGHMLQKIFFNHKRNNAQLTIKFKESETPEGVARINNKLTDVINH